MTLEKTILEVLDASGTISEGLVPGVINGETLDAMRDARRWSDGERLLINTAFGLWTGRGGPVITELVNGLDAKTFANVLRALSKLRGKELVPAGIADDLAGELQDALSGTLSIETARPVLAMYRGIRGLGIGSVLATLGRPACSKCGEDRVYACSIASCPGGGEWPPAVT